MTFAITDAAATQPAAATQGPRVAVIDAAPIGVDPAAAQYVTNVLRQAIGELGFAVIPTTELHEAARQIQLPFPVPVDGMVALEQQLHAPAAVTAEVRAASGLYIVRLRVRIDVEHQERVRRVSASQFQLADAVRAALPALLVPPSPDHPVSPEEPDTALAPDGGLLPGGPGAPPGGVQTPPARRRVYRAHPRRWEIGAGPIVAFGPGRDSFVNFLGAARVGFFPIDRLGITATLAYANLNGRDNRVSNFFFAVGVETAVDLVPSRHVFIPLRAEVGYLPSNGPVFRLTAGVAFQLARRVHLELDLLSPTLWVLPETTPVSLDVGAFVRFGL